MNNNLYKEDLFAFAISMTHDKSLADDIVQETYVKYFTFGYKHNNNLKNYLLTICRNTYIDYLRQKKEFLSLEDIYIIEENDKRIDDIKRIIRSQKYSIKKLCFMMQYYYGFKLIEIADLLNINISTVKAAVRRFKQDIRKVLI